MTGVTDLKRFTAHDTSVSGPHVWDHQRERAALFATMREADEAARQMNAGANPAAWVWRA